MTAAPSTGIALWWGLPAPARVALRVGLRARAAILAVEHGTGAESLVMAVGPAAPLRWLELAPDPPAGYRLRLWEVRQKPKEVATVAAPAAGLVAALERLAREHGLNPPQKV